MCPKINKVYTSVKGYRVYGYTGLTLFGHYANIIRVSRLSCTSPLIWLEKLSVQEGCLVQVTNATNG